MYVSSAIFLFFILSMCKCDQIYKNDGNEIISIIPNHDLGERRRLSVFPRRQIKYTVSPQTEVDRDKEAIATKKPLMYKMILKLKLNDATKTKEPVLRRSLMNLKSYTVKMRPIAKHVEEEKSHLDKIHYDKRTNDKVEDNRKKHSITRLDKHLKKIKTKETSKEESCEDMIHLSEIIDSKKFSFEDEKEFIFLENNKNGNKVVIDYLSSEEDIETTTNELEKKSRLKRRSNIIEEENKETTISGLKYTGRDNRLTNDIYFKNINS